MYTFIILNDAPYGNERSYNGLRMAKALVAKENQKVSVFLMSDAVTCAKKGQNVPSGFYNIELMLKSILRQGEVLLCGACMDARGITNDDVLQGIQRSSMPDLADHTISADKVLVF